MRSVVSFLLFWGIEAIRAWRRPTAALRIEGKVILNPLDSLGDEVNELVSSFTSQPIAGSLDTVGFTQYSFWFTVAVVLMLVVLFVFKKKQSASLVPQGVFVNGVEYLVEFVRDDMCKGLLGES